MNSSIPNIEDAVALHAYDAVYVEVPKVACSSIKLYLAELLKVDLELSGGNPHEAAFPLPPKPSLGPKAFPDLFSFSFVRNPWNRLASCYRDKILGQASDFTEFHPTRQVAICLSQFSSFEAGMSFERFVEAVSDIPDAVADGHFRSQHTFLTNGVGDCVIDFIGRFENLSTDFEAVCEKLGIPGKPLPHAQTTKSNARYTEYYTPKTRDLVAQRFRSDIEVFDYAFDRD